MITNINWFTQKENTILFFRLFYGTLRFNLTLNEWKVKKSTCNTIKFLI